MRVRGLGFDAAGAPGVTQLAYSAWRTWRLAGKTRYLGQMSGRDVYSVIPCKGLAGPNARPLQVVYPDHRRADRQARAGGNVPLALFNANAFKDDLAGQLAIAEGALRVHFPGALCGNFPTRPRRLEAPHAWFEQLVAEQRSPSGAWQKLVPSARNEALDLMVLTHVVARLHGLSRIDWTRPPPWAAPWETNTSIETAPGDSAATLPAPEGAQSSPGSLTAPGAPSSRFRALIKKMA
jgi:phage terminase large subunit GpA-like protein